MPSPDMGAFRRLLAALDRPLPRHAAAKPGLLRPASFALYQDPLDRYSFQYPSTWTLSDGPCVSSPTLGVFARVDLLTSGEGLEGRFPGLTLRPGRPGTPIRREGRLLDGLRVFTWTSWIFELRAARIALSTGSLEDAAAPSIRTYRRNILAAVRRHFRLSSGAR